MAENNRKRIKDLDRTADNGFQTVNMGPATWSFGKVLTVEAHIHGLHLFSPPYSIQVYTWVIIQVNFICKGR